MGGEELILGPKQPLLALEIRVREQRSGAVWVSVMMNGKPAAAVEFPKGEEGLAFVRDYMAGMCAALDKEKTVAVGEIMRNAGGERVG